MTIDNRWIIEVPFEATMSREKDPKSLRYRHITTLLHLHLLCCLSVNHKLKWLHLFIFHLNWGSAADWLISWGFVQIFVAVLHQIWSILVGFCWPIVKIWPQIGCNFGRFNFGVFERLFFGQLSWKFGGFYLANLTGSLWVISLVNFGRILTVNSVDLMSNFNWMISLQLLTNLIPIPVNFWQIFGQFDWKFGQISWNSFETCKANLQLSKLAIRSIKKCQKRIERFCFNFGQIWFKFRSIFDRFLVNLVKNLDKSHGTVWRTIPVDKIQVNFDCSARKKRPSSFFLVWFFTFLDLFGSFPSDFFLKLECFIFG